MQLVFHGEKGAYSHSAAKIAADFLSPYPTNIQGLASFQDVWEYMQNGDVALLPIENSYAGPIHENLYNFLRYDAHIIGEILLPIHHCLVSLENDISKVSEAYSHSQALSQCHDYLQNKGIIPRQFSDTAGAAKYIVEHSKPNAAAIASELSAEIYGLNVLDTDVQDQNGNTTRFFVVTKKESGVSYSNTISKHSLLFEIRHIPAALYKCLGSFALNGINLSKIESIPNLKDPFNYYFWLDFDGDMQNDKVKIALSDLDHFAKTVIHLWSY